MLEQCTLQKGDMLVVLKQSFRSNFGVKAAEISDHKSIRIALIRMDLRSLAVDDLSALSRSKFHQKLCLRTTRRRRMAGTRSRRPHSGSAISKSSVRHYMLRTTLF